MACSWPRVASLRARATRPTRGPRDRAPECELICELGDGDGEADAGRTHVLVEPKSNHPLDSEEGSRVYIYRQYEH